VICPQPPHSHPLQEMFLQSLFGVLVLATTVVTANKFFTPLNKGIEFACVAENLKESSTYYCDQFGQIRCLPGWTDPENHCKTPICEVNNQTCVNGNCSKPFTCDCEVGWFGSFCEKCVPLPGCLNGYCNRSLECICNDGWSGMTCDKPECPGCEHGECVMPGMCACHPGWSGPNCTICEERLDCKYGRCVDEPFECQCYSKYNGSACDQPMCAEGCHPEHGFCTVPEQCWCKPGWTGENCTVCQPYWSCVHGHCDENPWECICDDGWLGPDCNSTENTDGNWGKWGEWSECSKTCGPGQRHRTRSCDYPAPTGNGTYCSHDGSSCDDWGECNNGNCSTCVGYDCPNKASGELINQQLGIFDDGTFQRSAAEQEEESQDQPLGIFDDGTFQRLAAEQKTEREEESQDQPLA